MSYWYCPNCKIELDGCHVTYEELCEYCGTAVLSVKESIYQEELDELIQAKADGRLFIIPDGYEYAKEFYHVVNAPLWCVEDGWGCEDCPYEEEVGNTTDCKFKPYVSRLKPNTVLKAMYVLRNLFLSKEAADQALSTCNTTGESEHRRGGNE